MVRIVVKIKNTSNVDRMLYPEETYELPKNAMAVSVPSQTSSWGDEKIEVTVTLADGTESVIGGYGGIVKLIKDDKKLQIPNFALGEETAKPTKPAV
jgi:hypothetical protein